jgi:arylsulfatase A-like enzyme
MDQRLDGRRYLPAMARLAVFTAIVRSSLPVALAQRNASDSPKLVVVIVVDQMRADYITRFRGEWHGGLARLVEGGAWFRNAAYPYSGTETCSGHATIATGVFPETHGIIGNAWWHRQSAKTITCTQDVAVEDLSISRTATPGDSPTKLMAPSFGERLRAAKPGARVVTMSLKARAAIMLAGHSGDLVLWQDEIVGDWMTSSAYGTKMPAFVSEFVAANPITLDAGKTWEPSLAVERYHDSHSVAGENPPAGWTTSFPHPLAGNGAFLDHWRTSPFADEYLERLAITAVNAMKLGRSTATDFLGISFSAPDYVGHSFGPGSREIEDELLRLDRTIGKLLESLDRAVGQGNYTVVLTADHGVAPVPEQRQGAKREGGRVDGPDIVARVEKVLSQALGSGRHVSQMVDQNIYFEAGIIDRIHADPALKHDVHAAILSVPGIQEVFDGDELTQRSAAGQLGHAAALDEVPGRSGDIVIALKPYWMIASLGTTHGTANEYDQRVPLILFGKGIEPGEYAAASTPADIAPTLSWLCGVSATRTEGRILVEAVNKDKSSAADRR